MVQPTKWRNFSLPTEMVEHIEKVKPKYMSVAEFVRNAVKYYIDDKFPQYNIPEAEVPASG